MEISYTNSVVAGTPSQSYPANKSDNKMVESLESTGAAANKETDKQDIIKTVDALNKLMQPNNTHLSFVLHEKLQEYYVRIVDNQTDEVIREIPSKKILDMVAEMKSRIGLLIDEKR